MDTKNAIFSEDAARHNDEFKKSVTRAAKYVARLNYRHFSQFPAPLESMTEIDYRAIMGDAAKNIYIFPKGLLPPVDLESLSLA